LAPDAGRAPTRNVGILLAFGATSTQPTGILSGGPEPQRKNMNVSNWKEKREFVWEQMRPLEEAGLGHRKRGPSRDNFMLDPVNAEGKRLTARPDAKGGFIRAEKGGLLFRGALPEWRALLPEALLKRSINTRSEKQKGLGFRWTQIDESDIKRLFAAVMGEVRLRRQNTESRNFWALSADPRRYRITDAIGSLSVDWWKTKGSKVRKGDGVVIWKLRGNGERRGVIALGEVVTGPEVRDDKSNLFHIHPEGGAERVERVGVRYIPLRDPLWIGGQHDALLSNLNVARAHGGTVFKVEPEQWENLAAIAPENASDLETSGGGIYTGGQGFGLTPQERKAVEARAMKLAIAHYQGAWDQVEDVSASRCYDLECRTGRKVHHVEVKGTTGDGGSVLVTKNGVEHAQKHFPHVSLFVVSGIELDQKSGAAIGGKIRVLAPWDIKGCKLVPLSYQCLIPE
jgi:hypothetical protein